MKPVEIIYDRESFSPTLLRFLRALPIQPHFIPYSKIKDNISVFAGISAASRVFGSSIEKWPHVLKHMRNKQKLFDLAWQSFAMLTMYLRKNMADGTTIPLAEFHLFDPKANIHKNLILDFQAIQSL